MKNIFVAGLILLSTGSYAVETATYNTPIIEGVRAYYEARHASPLHKEKIMAKINCESDYNAVCKAINTNYSYAKEVKCKDESYGFLKTTLEVGSEFIFQLGVAVNNLLRGPEGQVQLQQSMVPGEYRYFYQITNEEITLEGIKVMNIVDKQSYPNEVTPRYISKITCE